MKKRARGLALSAAFTIVLWQFQAGRYALYPFTILATWFHEMAHGMCALLLGGSFVRLQLYPNGSGYALFSGVHLLGPLGPALVAGAGPLGPALAGSTLILASLRPRVARVGLTVLAAAMLVSALVWIRTPFGCGLLSLLAGLLLVIAFKGSPRLCGLALQFAGLQACISVFLQVGYLFTEQVVIGGRRVYSDTGQIAAALLLPYWFWALLLSGVTLWLLWWSLSRALGSR